MAGIFNRGGSTKHSDMSFIDHLEELRWHIIRSTIAILVFAVIIFEYRDWVFDNIIFAPITPNFFTYRILCHIGTRFHLEHHLCFPPLDITMQTTTFGGQFLGSISLAVMGGLITAFPYIFWELWRFIRPALKDKEASTATISILGVSFFFFTGILFGYFILSPFTFHFLGGFQIGSQHLLQTRPTLNDYIDNLTKILMGCGIAFELPIIATVLTKIGIISSAYLKRTRKFTLVCLLILAAFIAPSPDWYSQLLVFFPLWILYEIGIVMSKRVEKKAKDKEKEEWS